MTYFLYKKMEKRDKRRILGVEDAFNTSGQPD
jgi:hypothetical protein